MAEGRLYPCAFLNSAFSVCFSCAFSCVCQPVYITIMIVKDDNSMANPEQRIKYKYIFTENQWSTILWKLIKRFSCQWQKTTAIQNYKVEQHGCHWIKVTNQASSEYKHVLANILHSLFVARTPPVEPRIPDCRSNVENAPPRRRGVDPAQPAIRTMSSYLGMDASL